MTDWKQHDGGPQPVADDVWVEVFDPYNSDDSVGPAGAFDWGGIEQFTALNQHLIDAARLEGIRLGLEAAANAVKSQTEALHELRSIQSVRNRIRALDPEAIAKEASREP